MPDEPDYYIVTGASEYPQHYAKSLKAAEITLRELVALDPCIWSGATLVSCHAYFQAREQSFIDRPLLEVTSDVWNSMLGILPPLFCEHFDAIERFNISEMTFGRVTSQYARHRDRYFTRHVRHGDRSTYIMPDEIRRLTEQSAPAN